MRLIDADSIKFTEYVNGDITVSKEEIQKIPTALDLDKLIKRINEMATPTENYRYKFCGEVRTEYCVQFDDCADCMVDMAIKFIKSAMEGENE